MPVRGGPFVSEWVPAHGDELVWTIWTDWTIVAIDRPSFLTKPHLSSLLWTFHVSANSNFTSPTFSHVYEAINRNKCLFLKGAFIAAYFSRLLLPYYVIPPNAGVTETDVPNRETPERECPFQPAQQGGSSCTVPVTWSLGPWKQGGTGSRTNACLSLALSKYRIKKKKMPWQFNKNRKPEVKVSNDKWSGIVPRCLCKNGGKDLQNRGKSCAKMLFGIKDTFLVNTFFSPFDGMAVFQRCVQFNRLNYAFSIPMYTIKSLTL